MKDPRLHQVEQDQHRKERQLLREREQSQADLDLMTPIQLHRGQNLHQVVLLLGQVTVVAAEDLLQEGQVEGVKIAFSIYFNNL